MASNADSNLMSLGSNAALARQARRMIGPGLMLVMAGVIISAFLLPLAYMLTTAFRDDRKMTEAGGETPWYPATAASFEYNGEVLPILKVPTADGVRNWALLTKGREDSDFIDPANPAAGPINWKGSWRTLERDWTPYFTLDSITESWRRVNFTNLFKNSLFVSVVSVFFTLISCTIVAYGYARFKFPGRSPGFRWQSSTPRSAGPSLFCRSSRPPSSEAPSRSSCFANSSCRSPRRWTKRP